MGSKWIFDASLNHWKVCRGVIRRASYTTEVIFVITGLGCELGFLNRRLTLEICLRAGHQSLLALCPAIIAPASRDQASDQVTPRRLHALEEVAHAGCLMGKPLLHHERASNKIIKHATSCHITFVRENTARNAGSSPGDEERADPRGGLLCVGLASLCACLFDAQASEF